MDYFGILKKAWNITWRYKALWVLGLFAGVGSGGSSGGGGSNYSTGSQEFSSGTLDSFGRWMEQNWIAFAVVLGVLVLISLVFFVLSIAAQAGLVYGSNEAAENRQPSLRTAWGVGFGKWGRTFMIGFVLGLPIIVVTLVMAGLIVATTAGGAVSGDAGLGVALGGMCLILPLFGVLIVALAVIIGIVYQLALRYGVLQDVTFGQAIKRGWSDLWAKRGAFVFWLVMILPGMVYGVALILPILLFVVPAMLLVFREQYVIAGGLFLLMILVLMVPGAIYGTFVSTSWTIFFRTMTGMEPAGASTPTSGAGVSYAPPASPVPQGYAPPAPPSVADDAPIVDVSPPAPPTDV